MFFKIQNNLVQYLRKRDLTLYFLQAPLWIAAPVHLLTGRGLSVLFDVLLIAAICCAEKLTKDYFSTPFPSVDRRPIAAICLSVAVTLFFLGTLHRPPKVSLLFGLLAGLGYCLIYFGKRASPSIVEEKAQFPTLKLKQPKVERSNPEIVLPSHLSPTLKNMLLEGYQAIDILTMNAEKLIALRNEKRLGLKLNKISRKAREIIKQIEQYPERIRAARAFLVVHLIELRKISSAYLLDIERPNHDQQRKNFYQLLCESEEAFTVQHLELTTKQQEQLDIEIQVLRDQLKQGNFHD